MPAKIAYLGPAGTNSEEAVILYDSSAQRIPFPSVFAVAAAVEAGIAEEGIVAIENSIEGSVTNTLDMLIHESTLHIRQELILPINHHLLVKQGTSAHEIKAVFSHPQALAQCRHFLEHCFPKAQLVAAMSTVAAVEEMLACASPAAAIAPKRAAAIYGAGILAADIQDQKSNVTRFVVLAATDHAPTGCDKTSLCFSFNDDRPGLLFGVLNELAKYNINLSKIESRPSKERLGRYIFLVDLDGHRKDAIITEILSRIKAQTSVCKIFGSYPRYKLKKE